MNGALIVDKPLGPTSHDVVARVRHAIGLSRIGHTGTLDPLATGVLALVIGRATRLARFLSADEKEYVAGIRLGLATATYDAEERLVRNESGEPVLLLPVAHRPACTPATRAPPRALAVGAARACAGRIPPRSGGRGSRFRLQTADAIA